MAGYVLVRWTGNPSALDDPFVLRKLARGELAVGTVEALRRYDRLRIGTPPKAERLLGPESGFSRAYRFTTEAPLTWMDAADAARLFGNRWDRWEFLNVTDAPATARRAMQPRDWLRLLDDFSAVEQLRGNPMAPGGMVARRLA